MASAAELMVLFKGDTSGLDKATDESKGLIGGLVDGLGKLGLAGMGFGVIKDAASAIIGPLGDSISAAEGLGDAVARSDAIFGPASASVVAAAESQANALGLTKEAYIAAAGKMGDLVTGMGISGEKAAEMSTGLADIAPKLAAFTGMDPQSALDAMSKGLTGATKGLKEMGITIPEIPKGLDEAGKAAFIYDEILKQSGAASAAWAGNSGDVETSMARVSAAMTDAKAAIGEGLLPLIAPLAEKFAGLASTITENVGYAISDLQDGDFVAVLNDLGLSMDTATKFGEPLQAMFEELKTAFADAGGGMDGVVAIIDTLLEKLGLISAGDAGQAFQAIKDAIAGIDWAGIGQSVMTFAGAFKDGLMVVLPIVAALLKDVLWPVISAVFGFFKEHTGALMVLGAAFLALTGPVGAIIVAITALGALGPQVGEWVKAIGLGLVQGISGFVGDTIAAITAVAEAIVNAFKDYFGIAPPSTVFNDFGVNLLEGLINGIVATAQAVVDSIVALGDNLLAAIDVAWHAIWSVIDVVGQEIADLIGADWAAIRDNILSFVESIRVAISAGWDRIKEYLTATMDNIKAIAQGAIDAFGKSWEDGLDYIRGVVNTAWTAIGELIHTALNSIEDIVLRVMDFIETKTGLSMTAVKTAFDDAMITIHFVVDTIVALLTGDWGGALESAKLAAEAAWTAIKGYFSAGWQAIKDILKIDELVAIFDGLGDKLGTAVGKITDGLKTAFGNAWDTFKAWVTQKVSGFLDGIIGGLIGGKGGGGSTPAPGGPGGANAFNPNGMRLPGDSFKGLGETIGDSAGKAMAKIMAPLLLEGRTDGGALIEGKIYGDWGANAKVANGRMGLQKGAGIADKPDDNGVRADAFRSGRGGLLAASSSNYWQVFVARFGVPTEASARKVSKQLGIPLPKWLEDIFHPPQGETVDAPDVLKDPAPAAEAGAALGQLAKAASEASGAISKMAAVGIDLDALRGSVFKLGQNFDDLIPIIGGIVRALPPGSGGPGGIGIPIPGPGGSTTFGGGGSAGIPDVAINAQAVTLRGPLNIGMTAQLQVGGGRSLTAELVSALVVDTPALDKLIEAEDRRRAQKS